MKNDPKIITAKFDAICAETGKRIKKGDDMLYFPIGKKCFCLGSAEYVKFKEWRQDLTELNNPY